MDRGQLYTLEGIFAALVILLGLLFALQAATATPGGGGSLNPHAQQQDDSVATGVLMAATDEQLEQAVLFWNESTESFHCTPDDSDYYPGTSGVGSSFECDESDLLNDDYAEFVPPNDLGRLLHQRFGGEYSYNVEVAYNKSGSIERKRMVYQGRPGSSAVRATTSIALSGDEHLYNSDNVTGNPDTDNPTVENATNFYAEDTGGDLYNVIYVEVVVWRN